MLVDAHAHLDKYGGDLGSALAETREHQVFTVAVAMDVPSYECSRQIGEQCDLVLPTFGVHPRRAPQYADSLSELSRLIEESPAIGEIGLDFHWVEDSSQYPAQIKVLEYFLAAAREQKKIVNLHTKGAERKILELLEQYDIQRAIVHWYSGPLDILRALAQFGAYFTIGVEVLYSDAIKAIAKEIPDQLLLTETDNPGGLKWLNGVLGLPSDLHRVVEAVAKLRNMPAELVVRMIQKNFLHLIDHDPWLEAQRDLLWLPEH
jgi:TatD DNase family protein